MGHYASEMGGDDKYTELHDHWKEHWPRLEELAKSISLSSMTIGDLSDAMKVASFGGYPQRIGSYYDRCYSAPNGYEEARDAAERLISKYKP